MSSSGRSLAPTGAASGDLGGTYPAPAVEAMFGHGAAVQPTAYTNNSGKAPSKVLAAPTAGTVTTAASTTVTPFGYTTSGQADAIPLRINALVTDVANLEATLGQVVADLKALGITA